MKIRRSQNVLLKKTVLSYVFKNTGGFF